MDVTAEISGAIAAHRRLFEVVQLLDDSVIALPSLLPGWTIGHVLNHLHRNAESHSRLIAGALAGVGADRYPGGATERAAFIEDGAARSVSELLADIRSSALELQDAWARMTPDAWQIVGRAIVRLEPAHESPWRRWREAEIHLADLGLPVFGFKDWSRDFVRRELRFSEMAWRASHTVGLTQLPAGALKLVPHDRVAWLLGRLHVDGLPDVSA